MIFPNLFKSLQQKLQRKKTHTWWPFVSMVAYAFEANHGKQMFGNRWKVDSCTWPPAIPALKT